MVDVMKVQLMAREDLEHQMVIPPRPPTKLPSLAEVKKWKQVPIVALVLFMRGIPERKRKSL